MVEIKQQLVPEHNRKATYGKGNPKLKLVVHQTGNRRKGANAKMHAKLQERGYSEASWHIQSDDKEIIQSWPFDYRLWHASTGAAPNGGNMVGIAWEICINEDGNYLRSLEVAALGIAKVMKQEGIPMSELTTHNAEDPKNKWCPAQILSGLEGVNWDIFKGMVQKAYEGNPVAPNPAPTPKKKTAEQVAQEIADGKGGWGNNPGRANKLRAAGYDANTIQSRVNDILRKREGMQSRPSPIQPRTKTLHLPKGASSWRVYKPEGPYVANSNGQLETRLAPAKYGGLSYTIKGSPAPHVYLIDTQQLGRVAIYAHPDTGAKITG